MKAAYFDKYNKETKLELGELPIPVVGPEDVLVRVVYAAVNPVDVMMIHGDLKLVIPHKGVEIAGNEMVGIVKEVGSKVKNFKVGERVFGRMPIDKEGAFAEYVSIDQDLIAPVPEKYTDEEAAAIPLAALTIMQAIDLLKPKPGSTLFLSGGTGSLGQIAIPILKEHGLKVITSGNAKNKENVMKLGADQFIDYKTEDYSKILKNVNYVIDTVGEKELTKEFEILKPGGHLVSLKGMPNEAFAKRMHMPKLKQLLFKIAGGKYDRMAKKKNAKYDFVFVEPNGKQLEEGSQILAQRDIHPMIDKVYDLENINEALKKVENGSSKG